MTDRSYEKLMQRLRVAAREPAVKMEILGEFEAGGKIYPLVLMHLGQPSPDKLSVTVSAGIHGDEPAGVEAAVRFLEANTHNEALLSRFDFIIFPCDNPSGWERNTRENAYGFDLNRLFVTRHPSPEVALIMRALQRRCFDLIFEMHEDVDSHGFYLYELAEDPSEYVGEKIVSAVESMGVPINLDPEIEGLPASGGIIRPRRKRFRKTHLPKAVYTYLTCGGHVMTVEPPASALSLEERVKIHLVSLAISLESSENRTARKSR